jgi:hypothetical protein
MNPAGDRSVNEIVITFVRTMLDTPPFKFTLVQLHVALTSKGHEMKRDELEQALDTIPDILKLARNPVIYSLRHQK